MTALIRSVVIRHPTMMVQATPTRNAANNYRNR